MTLTSANVTHVLTLNGLGFANTKAVYPVTAEFAARAEARSESVNRMNGNGYSSLTTWGEASAETRKRALAWLKEFGTKAELEEAVAHAACLWN